MADTVVLTPRERQVLAMVTMQNIAIARTLGISEQTVKNILTAAYRKLLGRPGGVVSPRHRRTRALMRALALGVLELSEVPLGDWPIGGGYV